MFIKFKKYLMMLLAVMVVLPTSLAIELVNPAKAMATAQSVFINEFVSYPNSNEQELVELYNSGTSSVALSGWYITDLDGAVRYNFAPSDSLPANGFFTINMGANILNNDDDGMMLYDNTASTVDSVRYGLIPTRMMPPSAQGKSSSRVSNGVDQWAVNSQPTIGASNGNIITASLPSLAQVSATGDNPDNFINNITKGDVAVKVDLPSSSLATDTVTAVISTPTKPSSGTYSSTKTLAATQGTGRVLFSNADDLSSNYANFTDGTVKVGAYLTRNGISSEYFVGTNALKDTVLPTTATSASVAAGSNNPANVINSLTKTQVSVNVGLANNLLSTDTVWVNLNDSNNNTVNASLTNQTTSNVVVSGINTSTLTDGTITLNATVMDQAGNYSQWLNGTNAQKDIVSYQPTTAYVKAGTNNNENKINSFNYTNTSVNAVLPSSSLTTDTVTMELSNGSNAVSGSTSGSNGAGTVTVSGLNSTALNDGNVNVKVRIADANGNVSDWFSGTLASKDVISPSQPQAAQVKAGSGNSANIINQNNKNAAVVDVSLPASSQSSDTVWVELSDGTTTVSGSVAASSGAGTVTVNSINASTLNEGNIQIKARTQDQMGNYSNYLTGTAATKDTNIYQATAAAVKAGTSNGANIINSFNKSTVGVEVNLPNSALNSDLVTIKLSDGTNNKEATAAGITGGGILTINNIDASSLQDGSITVSVKTQDSAGNLSGWFSATSASKDTILPTATIKINNGATITNTGSVTLAFTSTGANSMQVGNNSSFTGAFWQAFSQNLAWNLDSGDGQKTVYLQVKDTSGNISSTYSDSIEFNSNTSSVTNSNILANNQTIFPQPGLELAVTGLMPTNLTVANYSQNPGQILPSGINGIGKYYEMALDNNSAVSWPIIIKIFYTLDDLKNAGISEEGQIVGIYYFDKTTNSWKLYSQTGVNTNDTTSQGVNYAGYIWANADHFTPITIGADITAPAKPANFAATAGDGEISLKWEKVSDAAGYYLRYRQGTDIDNKEYATIYLNGANSTSSKVTGLKNSTLYEFGVKAIDSVNNKSDWAVVIASPQAAVAAVSQETPSEDVKVSAKSSKETKIEKADEDVTIETEGLAGETKGESEEDKTKTTKTLVTLAIIILALGAASGGYYGYEWWTNSEKKKKPVVKKIEKTGRW